MFLRVVRVGLRTEGCLLLTGSGKLYDRFSWRAKSYESVNASVPVVIDEDKVFISECYGQGGVLLKFNEDLKASVIWKEEILNALDDAISNR